LLKYRVSANRWDKNPPVWDLSDNLLFIPRNFEARVKEAAAPLLAARKPGPVYDEIKHAYDMAGDKYFSRLGWMPRVHPLQLPSGRILVPLYSDGYNFSLIAISDDGGINWTTSEPIVSEGGVQPSIVRHRDGTLTAYMRDNGPAPKRVLVTHSSDAGVTWSRPTDTDIPNPGSGLEVIALKDGAWLLVNNDTERGRHSLSAWLSEDEGQSWRYKRHIEWDQREKNAGSFHYPSVVQTADGMIHVTYSYFLNHLPEGSPRKSIKHARFSLAWLRQPE
jgi:predicted neuraminidase